MSIAVPVRISAQWNPDTRPDEGVQLRARNSSHKLCMCASVEERGRLEAAGWGCRPLADPWSRVLVLMCVCVCVCVCVHVGSVDK